MIAATANGSISTSAPMRHSPSQRSTSWRRQRTSATRSGFGRPGAAASDRPPADAAGRPAAQDRSCLTPASTTRPRAGPEPVGGGRVRWHQANSIPSASVTNLSRPRSRWSNSTTARHYRALDQRGQTRSAGRGYPACLPARCGAVQLHALAYNLGNYMRTLTLPKEVEQWSLTTLREKLVRSAPGSCATAATWSCSWPRYAPVRRHPAADP